MTVQEAIALNQIRPRATHLADDLGITTIAKKVPGISFSRVSGLYFTLTKERTIATLCAYDDTGEIIIWIGNKQGMI